MVRQNGPWSISITLMVLIVLSAVFDSTFGSHGPEKNNEDQHHFRDFFGPFEGMAQKVTADDIRRRHKHQQGEDHATDMMDGEGECIEI